MSGGKIRSACRQLEANESITLTTLSCIIPVLFKGMQLPFSLLKFVIAEGHK